MFILHHTVRTPTLCETRTVQGSGFPYEYSMKQTERETILPSRSNENVCPGDYNLNYVTKIALDGQILVYLTVVCVYLY